MPKILMIDDDRIIRKIVEKALTNLSYKVFTASSGEEGLKLIKSINPDIVVTDKLMPGIDGFDLTRRLRREPGFAHIPILVLTGESDLDDKLDAFEAGADDYLSKPFETAELAARIASLLRRSEAFKKARAHLLEPTENAHLIAVHSLRGGLGCSSLAVNLAIGLNNLWQKPTMLLDMVLSSGQLALMLNHTLKRTWSDLSQFEASDIDLSTVSSIMGKHESGLNFIAAPANPTEAEKINPEQISSAMKLLRPRFHYMVADLPHDFSSVSLDTLDMVDTILLVLAPEIASIRAAAIALDTYSQLNYPAEKIKLVLNWTFEHGGLARKKIESALHYPISLVIPFAPRHFVGAINRGIPFIYELPEDPVSSLIEDFAFRSSKQTDQAIPPAQPSATWHRVNGRLKLFNQNQKKQRTLLFL